MNELLTRTEKLVGLLLVAAWIVFVMGCPQAERISAIDAGEQYHVAPEVSARDVMSGADVNTINVVVAGGGAFGCLMLTVLAWCLWRSLREVTWAIERMSASAIKSSVKNETSGKPIVNWLVHKAAKRAERMIGK